MKFKELTAEDLEYIASVHKAEMPYEEKEKMLAKRYDVTARTIRNWWRKMDLTSLPERMPEQLQAAWEREVGNGVDIILVTSAQNKSVAHKPLIKGMEAYRDFIAKEFGLRAEIVVIPTRYRNPTSRAEDIKQEADMWWDKTLDKYLHYYEIKFGDTLIDAMARVVPTAKMPLTGHEPHANGQNFVMGHPKMHLMTMPRFKGERSYVMATTGSCTYRNYSKSKAGDIAKIHHTYGFVVIEKRKDGICYAPRAVKANDDGTFTDYRYHYNGKEIEIVDSCQAYIWGDIHHRELCRAKEQSSRDLMFELNPEKIILHDVFDGSTVNPHERDDLFLRKLKIRHGTNIIEQEIDECLSFISNMAKEASGQLYVVQSNHDNFLDRHIATDWRKDLQNSEGYLKYALIQQTVDLRDHGNIFGYLLFQKTNGRVKYSKPTDSLKISGYICNQHGDHGVNGARGNVISFKRLNSKLIMGHMHSPQMIDNVCVVGVSCNLWQWYNSNGMSSWNYADAIIHDSGKNQLIIFDEWDYSFTTLKK